MAVPMVVLKRRQRLIEKRSSLSNKGNGAEEWRELIREGERQSDPEQFPSVSERDGVRGQGRGWYTRRS